MTNNSITSPISPLNRALSQTNLRRAQLLAWLLALATLSPGYLQATTLTWTGGGTDNNWGTAANWDSNAPPVSLDNLVFSGTTRLSNTNNISNLVLSGMAFTAGGFTLGGNVLTNTGGVYDGVGNNTNAIIINLGAAQTFSNAAMGTPLVFAANITNNGYALTIGGDGDVYLNGIVGGSGGLVMSGSGTLRLAGANTFAGGLTLNAGTVQLANAAAIPSGAGIGDVTINSGGTLDLNGNSQTINGLYGAGTVDNKTGTGTYTLTVGNNSTNSGGTFSGFISQSSGTIALTKVSTNTLILNVSSAHSGPTTISAGTLALGASGYISSTPSITVSPGAVFDVSAQAGSFSVGGSQTLTAGRSTNAGPNDIVGAFSSSGNTVIYRPGAAGTMTLGNNLSLNGGTLNYDLSNTADVGGGTNDLIVVNGTLTLGGTVNVQPNPIVGSFAAGTYTLILGSSPIVGSAANLAVNPPRGISAVFNTTTQPNNVLMQVSGTPSPGSIVWSGASTADWDVRLTQNWLNAATPDYFYNLDNAIFDDTAANVSVNLPGAVSPTSTTFRNSSATNYSISGYGAISGPGTLTVNGGGTVTLNTPNTYTGDTIVNNGSTLISGTLPAGPHTSVYNGVEPGNLQLGGGGFFLSDEANATYRADFSNLVVNPGAGSLAMRTRQSSSTYIIQIGDVSRSGPGGTVDFNNIQQKAASPQAGLLIINTNTVNGILNGYATLWENDWVVPVDTGAGSVAYAAYQTSTTPTAWGATDNVSLAASPSASLNDTVINSLRLSGAATVAINSGQTLTLTSGGLLVPASAGGAPTITGGTLKGAPNADLIVLENNFANALTIGSVIADNTGPCALTKSGQGKLTLTATNTYTGPTYINGPSLNAGNPTTPSTFPAGTLQLGNGGASGSIDTSSGVTNNGILAFNRSDAITFGLPMSGNGGLSVLNGNVALTGNNSCAGATVINAGTLQVGTGSTSGSLGNSPSVTDNGTLIFNRSDNVSFLGPISGTGSLLQQGSGRLTLGGTNSYQGSTTINAGTVALGASGSISNSAVIVVAAGATLDVSAVSGFTLNGGLVNQTLQGSGVVTGSVTTVTGTRLIPGASVGTLSFSNNLIVNDGTLQFEVGTNTSDLIQVSGNLTLLAGTVQLTTLNMLTDGIYPLIRFSGSLSGSAANLGITGFSQPSKIATLTNAVPGEIDLVVSTYLGANLVWQGNGVNNFWDVNATADWTNSSGTGSVFKQFDNVAFDDSSTNLAVNLQGLLMPALVTVNAVNDYTFQGNGQLAAGALTKNNTGTLTVLTTNSSTDPAVINGGTVQLGNGVAAGTLGAGPVNNNSALVLNEPGDQTLANAISGNGSITQQGLGAVTLIGNNTFSGPLTISLGSVQVGAGGTVGTLGTGPVTNNTSLTFNRSGSVTFSGGIAGFGTVTNAGVGTLTLSGVNTYIGDTVVANGTLKLGASEILPDGLGAGNVVLNNGASVAGTLDLNGFSETINGLVGAAGTVQARVLNNAPSTTSILTVGNEGVSTAYYGLINNNSGSGGTVALTKIGTGTLTLWPSSPNLWSGGTVISNGIVELQTTTSGSTLGYPQVNDTGLGTGPVTFYGGTLQLDGWSGSTSPTYGTCPNAIVVPTNQVGCVRLACRTAANGFNSTVTGGGTLYLSARYVRSYAAANFSGFTGTVIVTNNAAGATDATLGFGNAAGMPNVRLSIGTFGAGGTVTVFNRVSGNPAVPIGELSGDSGAILNNPGSSPGGQNCRWLVGGLNTSSTYGGNTANGIGFIKQGSGTFTLTGSTAHTGTTVVSNGVIALSGSATLASSTPIVLAAPGALDVTGIGGTFTLGGSAAQTLQGNGTLWGSLAVGASGTVSPGFSIGTLTVTNAATLGGTTRMEINSTNSPTSDRLVATNISFVGTLTVTNIGPSLLGGETFQLFSGTLIGAFATTNLPTLAPGLSWVTTNLNVNGTLSVVGSIIPPQVGAITVAGTTNIISGTGGVPNGTYYVLFSTNVTLPLVQWTRLATNTFAADGSFSYTNTAAADALRFYTVLEVLP